MADPFRQSSAPTRGIGRALRSRRASTIEAIEDLLASCERLLHVSAESVHEVCTECGVDIGQRFLSERKHLYRRYLAHCLEDKVLSEEENAELQHLRALLRLSDDDVTSAHDEVAREVYGAAVQEVLADLKLEADEEAFLRRLRGDLALSEDVARKLYVTGEMEARARARNEATAPDPLFLTHRPPAGEFTGRSSTTIDDAVRDALSKASVVTPTIHWFELTHLAGYVEEGRPKSWHVTVRAGIPPDA